MHRAIEVVQKAIPSLPPRSIHRRLKILMSKEGTVNPKETTLYKVSHHLISCTLPTTHQELVDAIHNATKLSEGIIRHTLEQNPFNIPPSLRHYSKPPKVDSTNMEAPIAREGKSIEATTPSLPRPINIKIPTALKKNGSNETIIKGRRERTFEELISKYLPNNNLERTISTSIRMSKGDKPPLYQVLRLLDSIDLNTVPSVRYLRSIIKDRLPHLQKTATYSIVTKLLMDGPIHDLFPPRPTPQGVKPEEHIESHQVEAPDETHPPTTIKPARAQKAKSTTIKVGNVTITIEFHAEEKEIPNG